MRRHFVLQGLDKGLLLTIFTLAGLGLVQVYSSSYILATETYGDGLFFFRRQLIFVALGLALLLLTAHIPHRWIHRYGFVLWGAATLGIALTLVPGLGVKVGGATRWLRVAAGFNFEPSELLKVSLPLMFASLLNLYKRKNSRWLWVLGTFILIGPMLLLLRQPDFGSFVICLLVVSGLLFAFGFSTKAMAAGVVALIPVFYFLVMRVPYRRERVMAFLDPWADPTQGGFQVIQSMLSFRSGGAFGQGLGQGQGKLFFLPEAHTDFTLAVLGEEMGLVGYLALLALYGFLIYRVFQLSLQAKNDFARALCLGLGLVFTLSVAINVGVVLGMLPPKGLTLPFLSYGGSSLLMTCFAFGLVLNCKLAELAPPRN